MNDSKLRPDERVALAIQEYIETVGEEEAKPVLKSLITFLPIPKGTGYCKDVDFLTRIKLFFAVRKCSKGLRDLELAQLSSQ